MWRFVVLLGACSFAPRQAGGGSAAPDAAISAPDAAIDAPPATVTCAITAMGNPQASGQLGSTNGGSSEADLACPAGELPIGFSFGMTPTVPMDWNQDVVKTTHVRCGKLERLSDGTTRVTPDATLPAFVAGSCGGWPDPVDGPELDCPAGEVVVAMSGNEATSGGTHSLFNTITMTCAKVGATGMLAKDASAIAFADTGANTDRLQAPACPPEQAVIQFGVRGGCGQDMLQLQCAPLVCQ